MGCVNCGNDDGDYKICLPCLELIDCKCEKTESEYLVTIVSTWSVFAKTKNEAIETFSDGQMLDSWNYALKRDETK